MRGKDAAITLWNKRATPSVAVAQDAQTVRDVALEDAALLAIRWGNARVDDGGGHALRNYAEAVRSLKSSGDARCETRRLLNLMPAEAGLPT